jgi:hypothetical protein
MGVPNNVALIGTQRFLTFSNPANLALHGSADKMQKGQHRGGCMPIQSPKLVYINVWKMKCIFLYCSGRFVSMALGSYTVFFMHCLLAECHVFGAHVPPEVASFGMSVGSAAGQGVCLSYCSLRMKMLQLRALLARIYRILTW